MVYGAILGTSPATANGEDDFGARTTTLGATWASVMASGVWTGATASSFLDMYEVSTGNILGLGFFVNAATGYPTRQHVFRSTDGGLTFLPLARFTSGTGTYDSLTNLNAILGLTSSIVLVALAGFGTVPNSEAELMRSTDGGATWTQIVLPMFDPASAGSVNSLVHLGAGVVLAGGNQEAGSPPDTTRTNPCVWRSTDYGVTWSAPYFIPGLSFTGGNLCTLNRLLKLSASVVMAGLSNDDALLPNNGHWVLSTDAGLTFTTLGTRIDAYPGGVAFGRFNSIGAADDGSVLTYLERSSVIGPGTGEIWRTTFSGYSGLAGPCSVPAAPVQAPVTLGPAILGGSFSMCVSPFTVNPCPQQC
jgi:hypothetical protein